jgi:hypothetical protein
LIIDINNPIESRAGLAAECSKTFGSAGQPGGRAQQGPPLRHCGIGDFVALPAGLDGCLRITLDTPDENRRVMGLKPPGFARAQR